MFCVTRRVRKMFELLHFRVFLYVFPASFEQMIFKRFTHVTHIHHTVCTYSYIRMYTYHTRDIYS